MAICIKVKKLKKKLLVQKIRYGLSIEDVCFPKLEKLTAH